MLTDTGMHSRAKKTRLCGAPYEPCPVATHQGIQIGETGLQQDLRHLTLLDTSRLNSAKATVAHAGSGSLTLREVRPVGATGRARRVRGLQAAANSIARRWSARASTIMLPQPAERNPIKSRRVCGNAAAPKGHAPSEGVAGGCGVSVQPQRKIARKAPTVHLPKLRRRLQHGFCRRLSQ